MSSVGRIHGVDAPRAADILSKNYHSEGHRDFLSCTIHLCGHRNAVFVLISASHHPIFSFMAAALQSVPRQRPLGRARRTVKLSKAQTGLVAGHTYLYTASKRHTKEVARSDVATGVSG